MRGHWHALGHVFASEKCGTSDPKSVTAACNPISGHLFSRDGLTNWTTSDVEPYSFAVDYDDGTSGLLATRERPKLLFDATTGEPTHLYTAASPMPPEGCKSCTHPRKSRDAGSCVGCKTSPPWGRAVFTMVTPLRQKTDDQPEQQADDDFDVGSALEQLPSPLRYLFEMLQRENVVMLAASPP